MGQLHRAVTVVPSAGEELPYEIEHSSSSSSPLQMQESSIGAHLVTRNRARSGNQERAPRLNLIHIPPSLLQDLRVSAPTPAGIVELNPTNISAMELGAESSSYVGELGTSLWLTISFAGHSVELLSTIVYGGDSSHHIELRFTEVFDVYGVLMPPAELIQIVTNLEALCESFDINRDIEQQKSLHVDTRQSSPQTAV